MYYVRLIESRGTAMKCTIYDILHMQIPRERRKAEKDNSVCGNKSGYISHRKTVGATHKDEQMPENN